MTQQLGNALENSEIVYITTFDRDGVPGTVPVWFVIRGASVFITTSPASKKVRKLQENATAELLGQDRQGPSIQGKITFRVPSGSDVAVAGLFIEKYGEKAGHFWPNAEKLLASWQDDTSLLLEFSTAIK